MRRRALVTVHIAASVSWLGVSLGMLTLGLFGRFADDERSTEGAYWAARVFVDVLVIPLSVVSWLTGTWLGVVTKWGLLRHKWVVTKFVLTTITLGLGLFSLRPGVLEAYRNSGPGGDPAVLADASTGMLFAGVVSSTTYLLITAISVFKPWGRTRYRARGRSEPVVRVRASGPDRSRAASGSQRGPAPP